MKIIITLLSLLCVACMFPLAAAELATPAVFQICLVKAGPGPDTAEMAMTHSTKGTNRAVREVVHVQKTPLLDHTALASAAVRKNAGAGLPQIEITFTEKGRKRFADVTHQNIGNRLAIIVEGRLLSAPRILEEISGGKAMISGRFSKEEATELAIRISAAVKK